MAWKKGQSGNLKGGPRFHDKLQEYLGAAHYCRPIVPRAVRRLDKEMEHAKSSAVRVAAAAKIIAIAEPEAVQDSATTTITSATGIGSQQVTTVNVRFGKKAG